MKTEKALQSYLFRKCEKAGIYCRKMSSPGRRGFPDVLLKRWGFNTLLVEVKTPAGTGVLSALQVREIALLREHGMQVEVISSKEEVDAIISYLTGR